MVCFVNLEKEFMSMFDSITLWRNSDVVIVDRYDEKIAIKVSRQKNGQTLVEERHTAWKKKLRKKRMLQFIKFRHYNHHFATYTGVYVVFTDGTSPLWPGGWVAQSV